MAGSVNDIPDPNITPDPYENDPSKHDHSGSGSEVGSSPPLDQETPLPDFEPNAAEPLDRTGKRSGPRPQDLDVFLTGQRDGEELEIREPTFGPSYRVSPAESDLAGHILPSEETPEEEYEEIEEPPRVRLYWWIRQILLIVIAGFYLVFGIQLLFSAYALNDPTSFIFTFYASNFIILFSSALLVGFIYRLLATYHRTRKKLTE